MRSKSGGGITSKNKREVGYRTGTGSKATRPGGVAQIGIMYGSHVTEGQRSGKRYAGEKLHGGPSFQPVKFGNELAVAVKCGPGGSREVFKSGSQHGLPPAKPNIGSTRDTLAEFGPDSDIVRSRK